MDYRYFPDPDLLPLEISAQQVEAISRQMPELPEAKLQRFVETYELSAYDARLLTASVKTAEYFEAMVRELGVANAKLAANWMNGELLTILNREDLSFAEAAVRADQVALILEPLVAGQTSLKATKELLQTVWQSERANKPMRFTKFATSGGGLSSASSSLGSVLEMAKEKGLLQISNATTIEKMVDDVIAANPKSVEEYKGGKEKALNALFGQVMKASNKTANPAQVTEILKRKLSC